jgi:hypothetical protein
MSGIALVFAFLVFVGVAIYTAVLFYHWLRYGLIYSATWLAMPVYSVGALVLLFIMFGAAAAI